MARKSQAEQRRSNAQMSPRRAVLDRLADADAELERIQTVRRRLVLEAVEEHGQVAVASAIGITQSAVSQRVIRARAAESGGS